MYRQIANLTTVMHLSIITEVSKSNKLVQYPHKIRFLHCYDNETKKQSLFSYLQLYFAFSELSSYYSHRINGARRHNILQYY